MRFSDLTEVALNAMGLSDIFPFTQNSSGNDLKVSLQNVADFVTQKRTTKFSNLGSTAKTLKAAIESLVPTTRKVNNKALSSDITLSASDVGAVPTSRTVNSKALSSNISLTAADVGAVPTTRTVNSKALSANITLSASDVGAVPTTRTVNGHALSANVTVTASDLGLANSSTYSVINSKSVADSTDTNLGNTGSLAIGTYIIIGEAYIGSTDNSTGRRALWFSTTSAGSTPVNRAQQTIAGTAASRLQVVLVISITSATTYYLNYYQNSGGAKNVTGSITILKIHG